MSQKLAAITCFCIGMDAIILGSIYVNWVRGIFTAFDFILLAVLQVFYYMHTVSLTVSTRHAIRRIYRIPQCCGRASDVLVSILFTPLVIAQMGRHTLDCDKYESSFFSHNGLRTSDTVELSDPDRDNYLSIASSYEPPQQEDDGFVRF